MHLLALLLSVALTAAPQEAAAPLPDLASFLKGVRRTLRSDRLLLGNYTYQERVVIREQEKDGRIKKTRERLYEVYPHTEEDLTFRKLVSRDGKALRPDELAKQDRDHDKRLADYARKTARGNPQSREAREAEEKKKEDEILDEVFRMYDVKIEDNGARNARRRPDDPPRLRTPPRSHSFRWRRIFLGWRRLSE